MRSYKAFLCLYLLSGVVSAQNANSVAQSGVEVHVSLLGAIKYPGVKLGLAYKLNEAEKHRLMGKSAVKRIYKSRFITANLGGYYHQTYNANSFLLLGYQFRRMNGKGWFRTVEPQLGVSRTWVDGTVYRVDDAGTVKKINRAGDTYLAPAFSLGLGKDFSVTNPRVPLAVFGKITLLANLPYNNFVYIRPVVELGVSYQLRRFLRHSVVVKHRSN